MPKNPRRLSELEANLSRRERRKSKAWAGESHGIAEDFGDGEGGSRKSSGPLDAEEMKELLLAKLRRVSTVLGDVVDGMLMVILSLVIEALVQSVVMMNAGYSWLVLTFQLGSEGWLVVLSFSFMGAALLGLFAG